MNEPTKFTEVSIAQRWTPLLIREGWTPISNTFLRNYSRLSPAITNAEFVLIVHLIAYKWGDEAPFPSIRTLAKLMGVTPTSVRNSVRSLRRKGYLKQTARPKSRFDLSPLFAAMEKTAFPAEHGDTVKSCSRCGRTGGQNENFCVSCGARLETVIVPIKSQEPLESERLGEFTVEDQPF